MRRTKIDDRRKAERRVGPAERRTDPQRAARGERRVMDARGMARAMVDALEDILAWERGCEH